MSTGPLIHVDRRLPLSDNGVWRPQVTRRRTKTSAHNTRLAVGYARVSTERQANEGVSLEAQRARIAAWCIASGRELVAMHVDAGISGGRADNRPALQAALDEVCQRGGALIVYSLSRLARSTRDAIAIADRLDNANADLVFLTEAIDTTSATGRLFFRMMAALAEFERDLTAERTRGALAHKRAKGERISRHAPFGYRFTDAASLEVEPGEAETLLLVRQWREGGASYRAITDRLNAEHVRCRGQRWHLRSVWVALNRRAA
jgi:site-specific DNA recombinase